MVSVKTLTGKEVIVRAGTVIGRIEAVNVVPHMLVPKSEMEPEEDTKFEMDLNPKQLSVRKEAKTTSDLNSSNNIPEKHKLTQEEIDLLMGKLDLSGIKDWRLEEQQNVRDLILEYGPLFALKDMDLGRTDKVKHSIKLNDYPPFKERYRYMPPHQYEEVKQHLKVYGPKFVHTSAVCIATLLVPHGPDLIPRGC